MGGNILSAAQVSRHGDIWLLGEHRLICGDAADPATVSAVMGGDLASMLFTSPPYANQRNYTTGGIADWDALMQGVFGASCAALRDDAQILVNLGLVHRGNEWHAYWDDWIAWMRTQGFRRFGWYVWDKVSTLPGYWAGRLAPRHEFVFHFNRISRLPNKIVPCKYAGKIKYLSKNGSGRGLRGKNGKTKPWCHVGRQTQDFRIPDSVVSVLRQNFRIGKGIYHPAVFPVGLPRFFMEVYTNAGEIVYEPFSGSGTSILAGEITGRRVRAVEIAPEYVDVTLLRWMKRHPDKQPLLAGSGKTFDEVAAERDADEVRDNLDALERVASKAGRRLDAETLKAVREGLYGG